MDRNSRDQSASAEHPLPPAALLDENEADVLSASHSHPHELAQSEWWSSSRTWLPNQPDNVLSPASPSAYPTPFSDSFLPSTSRHSPYDASPQLWPRSMSFVAPPVRHTPSTIQPVPQPAPAKQIRFIPSNGQPHKKRRRITAACLTCRKRKVRCSGEHPKCTTCTENGQACGGYASGTRRKSNAGVYDNSNESDNETDSEDSIKDSKNDTEQSSRGSALSPQTKRREISDGPGSKSPASNQTTGTTNSTRHRAIPYFRYFGPTAIVPGFKQMVVQLKDHRRSAASVAASSPGSIAIGATPIGVGQPRPEIPFYDATDSTPNAPLITHLCETFFTHLGCNYPFLQRQRFLHDLEEKRVDAILVDAVCGVAARFSSDPLLSIPSDDSVPVDLEGEVKKQFRGHAFIQRAMSSVTDTFLHPTIAVAQACLLLAYEEFGTDHDSGLWMYLGTSIRLAQDLGIQKLEGLQLEGRIGPTPKTSKSGQPGKDLEARREAEQTELTKSLQKSDEQLLQDRRASERERIDTFYAIFFLDRAVSSGVGRPVTLRDKDIEISFPYHPDDGLLEGWPHPFPPMIRTVHMYGRVADVLNNLNRIDQVTPEVLKRLAGIEKDLTGMYQRLSPKLHFNPTNFQHYVKAQQGTNFILLHFWFHTLIILLHQPTLLHSFDGQIQQLFPDSRELSMSSAKTIADIIAFAELIDVKSIVGNPFTSQPMYIAARAFLAEAAAHASQPASRGTTPPTEDEKGKAKSVTGTKERAKGNKSGKSSLLHSAANTNYQRCYKALKVLDGYWAGCRYILTALDQMSTGLMDPLLFTSEDVDEMPSTVPSFTTPGWRRSTTHRASMGAPPASPTIRRWQPQQSAYQDVWSPGIDLSQAIGWSLTGTANSPAPNFSFLYQNRDGEPHSKNTSSVTGTPQTGQPQNYVSRRWTNEQASHAPNPQNQATIMMPPAIPAAGAGAATADANVPLSMNAEYTSGGYPYQQTPASQAFEFPTPTFENMPLISQDIDMSNNFAFPGSGDVIPWLEYLPQDVLSYFGEPQHEIADPRLPNG